MIRILISLSSANGSLRHTSLLSLPIKRPPRAGFFSSRPSRYNPICQFFLHASFSCGTVPLRAANTAQQQALGLVSQREDVTATKSGGYGKQHQQYRSLTTEAARPREGGRAKQDNQAPARPRTLSAWPIAARQRPAGRGDDKPGHPLNRDRLGTNDV